MIVDSVAHFRKALLKKPTSILIVGKEEKEQALFCLSLENAKRFNKELFDPKVFIEEFESSSFLAKERVIVVEELEKFSASALECLVHACERPCPGCQLVLVGESATPTFMKGVELVLKLATKRPYERENDLAAALVARAKSEGVMLTPDVAHIWVKSFGAEAALLERELDKMLCYVGYQGEITLASVREFSITLPHLTLWQLGDAIFARSRSEAWKVLHTLLEEGGSIYQILSHLRTQFETGIRILAANKRGSLTQEFPYLKGGLVQKKVSLLSSFGVRRLKQGLCHLFDTELHAKSQNISPDLLLEPLLVKITA
ncbi:MAG: hypothetical protein H7A36_05495 [Chlamydiales bacterium]|nr:hypothetical protein [Chlamydiales bacterium]